MGNKMEANWYPFGEFVVPKKIRSFNRSISRQMNASYTFITNQVRSQPVPEVQRTKTFARFARKQAGATETQYHQTHH